MGKVWKEEWGCFDAYMGRIGFGRIRRGTGQVDVTYATMDQDFDAPARAQLAAAAPDLVQALLPLLRWADAAIDNPVPPGGNQDAAGFVRVWHVEKARAALRKAGVTTDDLERAGIHSLPFMGVRRGER